MVLTCKKRVMKRRIEGRRDERTRKDRRDKTTEGIELGMRDGIRRAGTGEHMDTAGSLGQVT